MDFPTHGAREGLTYAAVLGIEACLQNQSKLGREGGFEGFEVLEHRRALAGREQEIRIHHLPVVGPIENGIGGGYDDAEVETCSSDAPEQVAVLIRAGSDEITVRRHQLNALERVNNHAMKAAISAYAAS